MSEAPIRRIATIWLPAAVAATVLCGIVELTVQQNFRSSADDPQIQLAEDAARGVLPAALSAAEVDLAVSLAPWLVRYDDAGRASRGTGRLDGALPELPPGVFEAARSAGEHRVTWQLRPGVRQAVVVTRSPDRGFFVAGRSLREVERREAALARDVVAAWIAAVAGSFAAASALVRVRR